MRNEDERGEINDSTAWCIDAAINRVFGTHPEDGGADPDFDGLLPFDLIGKQGLSDEEVEEAARVCVAETVRGLAIGFGVFPLPFGDRQVLVFNTSSPAGDLTMFFDVWPAAVKLVRFLVDGFGEDSDGRPFEQYVTEVVCPGTCARLSVLLTLYLVHARDVPRHAMADFNAVEASAKDFSSRSDDDPREAFKAARGTVNQALSNMRRQAVARITRGSSALRKIMAALHKRASYSFYDIPRFAPEYDRLLSEVERRKRLRLLSGEGDWRDVVKVAKPEMPDDLIERLAAADKYESMSSHIALEWTARVCGARPDQFSSRTLFKHLEESQSLRKKTGEGTVH